MLSALSHHSPYSFPPAGYDQRYHTGSQILHIALNESYLPAAKIDTALAIGEVNGPTQIIRLQPADNQLTASLNYFKNAGTGTLAVQLFTQTKSGGQPLQREKRFTYKPDKTKPLSLIAPSGKKDTSWDRA